jgi:hypothetical protein
MSNVVSPIHVGTVNGMRVRFYQSPDGKPDQPWHSVDDLQSVFGLNRATRRLMMGEFRNGKFKHDFRTIATADGLVTIAPHHVAQGSIGAMEHTGGIPKGIFESYVTASSEAMGKLIDGLGFGSPAWVAFMREALSRNNESHPMLAVLDEANFIQREGETFLRITVPADDEPPAGPEGAA